MESRIGGEKKREKRQTDVELRILRASFALSRVIRFAPKESLLTGHAAIAPTNTDVDANYSGSIQRSMLIMSR